MEDDSSKKGICSTVCTGDGIDYIAMHADAGQHCCVLH